jgi:hypothetical protein
MASIKSTLRQLPSGQWAIAAPGRAPVAIIEGEVFEIEVGGKMKLARMERRRRPDGTEMWVTAQGYKLRAGVRARFVDQRERFAKPIAE